MKPVAFSHGTLCALFSVAVLAVGGCASSPTGKPIQFAPAPLAKVGAQELEPVQPRSEWELLAAANEAFREANAAQEGHDKESALRHYERMLELLIEADLDPGVYYDLRNEFERILNSTVDLAKLTEQDPPPRLEVEVMEFTDKSQLAFPNPINARVLKEVEFIQSRYPKGFQNGLNRSSRYLPYIQEEFRKAGLPADLAWLAMVESQFVPKIDSRVGAGGMWQFMKGTARRYGLRIDYYVDERYDWKKSTKAAIAYLSDLYDMFDGNWPLAVSAYNKGEYGLERAIASNGGERNLWRLLETPPAANRLPLETKKFYAKLLASVIVSKDARRYGMTKTRLVGEQSAYATVEGSYSLRDIERALGLSKSTLQKLNPHLLRGITPPGRTCEILVPTNSRIQFASVLASLPQYRADTHVVQRGETLSKIAQHYNVNTRELMDTNNIRSAKRLQIGQRLAIPHTGTATTANTRVASAGSKTYTVRKGDTPTGIASRHRIALSSLLTWNKLDGTTPIYVGDTLYVAGDAATAKPTGEAIIHVVKKGEYPGKIASTYRVALNDFLAWNNLSKNATIRVGDKLKIYSGKPALGTPQPTKPTTIHTVASGDNASTIAAKYGVRTSDVLRWNNLNQRSVLRIGQKLTIRSATKVASAPKASGPRRVEHVVSKGQNPWVIAKRYGVKLLDLFQWNDWKDDPVLDIGDTVVVYTD